MEHAEAPFTVQTKKQLAALTSPIRQQIVDVLSQMGTISVAELAATLGRPADAVYYHLRVLKLAGLVLVAGLRSTGNRKEELIRAVSRTVRLQYDLGNAANSRQINAIVASMLRMGIRDFGRAFAGGNVKVAGSQRELWAARRTAWLSPTDISGVNRLMEELVRTVGKPRAQGRLYAITMLLTPLDNPVRTKAKKTTR
jgi:DNA-binding transcriptional ArsR family regulator